MIRLKKIYYKRKKFQKRDREYFKKRYEFDIPELFDKNKVYFTNDSNRFADEEIIKDWLRKNQPAKLMQPKDRIGIINEIYHYNRSLFNLQKEYENREREKRFILKKNIPLNPDFMEIVIESKPDEYNVYDDEFMEEVAKNYLELVNKHQDVFLDNKNFRLFKNYLRSKING